MVRVIVITSSKDGVGKTITIANLGMCLAKLGYKTILIDFDIEFSQRSFSNYYT
jgi:septum site-determining protein MinD